MWCTALFKSDGKVCHKSGMRRDVHDAATALAMALNAGAVMLQPTCGEVVITAPDASLQQYVACHALVAAGIRADARVLQVDCR